MHHKHTHESRGLKKTLGWIRLRMAIKFASLIGVKLVVDPASAGNEHGDHFGEHYMLDGYRGSREKLSDPARIIESIKTIASVLGMTCAMEPVIKHVPGNGEKDHGGDSAFVIIYESHISVHAFPNQGFVTIDVYTCKPGMDTETITKHFVEYFELDPKLAEVNFVIRGRGFSKYRTA